jgi:hypothetical protein
MASIWPQPWNYPRRFFSGGEFLRILLGRCGPSESFILIPTINQEEVTVFYKPGASFKSGMPKEASSNIRNPGWINGSEEKTDLFYPNEVVKAPEASPGLVRMSGPGRLFNWDLHLQVLFGNWIERE